MKNKSHSGRFRHIQKYPDIIRHIQAYSGIIQPYSKPCLTLEKPEAYSKPGIPKTLAHSEPETDSESWAIQNPGIFRTGGILRSLSNIYDREP